MCVCIYITTKGGVLITGCAGRPPPKSPRTCPRTTLSAYWTSEMASTDKIRSHVGILNIVFAYWPAAASAWYIQGMVITAL